MKVTKSASTAILHARDGAGITHGAPFYVEYENPRYHDEKPGENTVTMCADAPIPLIEWSDEPISCIECLSEMGNWQ